MASPILPASALFILIGAASSPARASVPIPPEVCDGADNDLDGMVDEGFDRDGDGVADCFDTEECDGLDNDGDGVADEDFDADSDGVADCFDAEICDGLDNDGDGLVDEHYDGDADGVADCFDTEECDGVDNNGDGAVDEGVPDGDGDGVADCVDSVSDGCTFTQGYWKNHPEVWPVTSLLLGARTYSQATLRTLLDTAPKGDKSIQLAHQLIAAKRNIASGAADDDVATVVTAADVRPLPRSPMRLLYFAIPMVLASAPPPPPPLAPPADGPPAVGSEARDTIDIMIHLPHAAQALVGMGVPEAEVSTVLTASESAGRSAADAGVIIQAAETQVKAHGPIDNFGAFVQSQLASGARGKGGGALPPGKAKGEGEEKAKPENGTAHAESKPEKAETNGKAAEGAGKNRGPSNAGKSDDAPAQSGGKGGNGKSETQGKGKNRRAEDAR